MTGLVRQLSLAVMLILAALLVNLPIIQFEVIYPEQALMYVANQKIQHVSDLLNVYFEPRFLHYNIPFFRPSGHFLMYQLLTPIFGWHNLKALTIVNLSLLGLAGFYMVRLYTVLFRGFLFGSFIAFAIYISHPSLALIKISILHFEYAHVLFGLMGIYYFVLFCQENENRKIGSAFKKIHLLCVSLFMYVVAVTFKEPAIILGAVYAIYLLISQYHRGSLPQYIWQLSRDISTMKLLCLMSAVMGIVVIYMMLPWPGMHNPMHTTFTERNLFFSLNKYLQSIFNLDMSVVPYLTSPGSMWNLMVFPYYETVIMVASAIAAIAAGVILFRHTKELDFKKSFLFLCGATLIFLVIPLGWGVGAPWHYNLSLITLSLLFGFSIEYLGNIFISNSAYRKPVLAAFAIVICFAGMAINRETVKEYTASTYHYLTLKLNYNAIYGLPVLKDKLHDKSVIVVGEEIYRNPNLLGAGMYPLMANLFFGKAYYINSALTRFLSQANHYYLPLESNYNGTLFRWALQKPGVSEEIIPFENLTQPVSSLIYSWLRNYKDLHYVSYDEDAKWHDLTAGFKKELLAEKARRQLRVRHYIAAEKNMPARKIMREVFLPGGDPMSCQYLCDQTKGCNAVRYHDHGQATAMCKLYR